MSGASNTIIHTYSDRQSIRTVALARDVGNVSEIIDASAYDVSSRSRSPHIGDIVIWQNSAGYFMAAKIKSISLRSHGRENDEVHFSYEIFPSKSPFPVDRAG